MAEKKTTELTVQESRELLLNPAYQTLKQFEIQQRMAQMYVQSTIVPNTYKGNIGNCVIAIDMAQRMHVNPLMVMQNLYIINGQPAWSSKFLISCINTCGRFTPLRYQFYGKKGTQQYACRAFAYEKSDKERKDALCGAWITMEMAAKEGWSTKPGSKWQTMPEQMLIYRAAAFWSRAYAPEISMGFYTKEEIEDANFEDVTNDMMSSDIPVVTAEEAPQVQEPAIDAQPEPQKDAPKQEAPKDMISASMQKQNNKTPYRAPHPKEEVQEAQEAPENADSQTGELFNDPNQQ